MTIKLLAFDLDGTLIHDDKVVRPADRAAIEEARRAGLEVMIVTGRSWRGARRVYDELGLTGPCICYLGALTVADGTGRISAYRPLAAGAWETLRAFALREGLPVTACVGTDQAVADGDLPAAGLVAADTAFSTCAADDFNNWAEWNPYTTMAPDLAPCQAPPIMLAVYGDRAVRRTLAAFPNGLPESQFDLYDKIAGETVLHIWHESVSKGHALAEHCRRNGIRLAEVAAFGDMPMDLTMLRIAGIGVAVPTAHPAVRAEADWVAEPHAAIARILEGAL